MKKLLSLIIVFLFALTIDSTLASVMITPGSDSTLVVVKMENIHYKVQSFPPTSITSLNIGSIFNFSSIRSGAIYYIQNKVFDFERREINKDKSYIKASILKPYQRGKERRKEKRRLKEEERINDIPPIYR